MTLTMKHLQSALDRLGRLRPARPNLNAKRGFSMREAIFFIAPKLTEMKELGCSMKELAAALAEEDIVIKAPTLNRYLSEYQAGRKKEVTTEVATAAPSELKAAPPDEIETVSAESHGASESSAPSRPEPFTAAHEDYGQLFKDHE